MKSILVIFLSVLLWNLGNAQVQQNNQELISVGNITIENANPDNVRARINFAAHRQSVPDLISQSNVNAKAGFVAEYSRDNTSLVLNFTQKFNETELVTLLEYCGIRLELDRFRQLENLLK